MLLSLWRVEEHGETYLEGQFIDISDRRPEAAEDEVVAPQPAASGARP